MIQHTGIIIAMLIGFIGTSVIHLSKGVMKQGLTSPGCRDLGPYYNHHSASFEANAPDLAGTSFWLIWRRSRRP